MEIFRDVPDLAPDLGGLIINSMTLGSPRFLKRETFFLLTQATCLSGGLRLGLGCGVLILGRECGINSKHRIFAGNCLQPQRCLCEKNSSLSMPRRKNPERQNSREERKLSGSTQVRRGSGANLEATWAIHPLSSLASSVEVAH